MKQRKKNEAIIKAEKEAAKGGINDDDANDAEDINNGQAEVHALNLIFC